MSRCKEHCTRPQSLRSFKHRIYASVFIFIKVVFNTSNFHITVVIEWTDTTVTSSDSKSQLGTLNTGLHLQLPRQQLCAHVFHQNRIPSGGLSSIRRVCTMLLVMEEY
jgi:hypothetical protein